MGIQDRDYYRKESPNLMQYVVAVKPFTVTILLIIANLTIYLVQITLQEQLNSNPDGFSKSLILDVTKIRDGEVWRLFSYGFLHDTSSFAWGHLLINMILLWFFGRHLEQEMGSQIFLRFYLFSLLLSGIGFLIYQSLTNQSALCIGSSGAIASILLYYACSNPKEIVFVWFIPMQIWVLVTLYIMNDVFGIIGMIRRPAAISVIFVGGVFGYLQFKLKNRTFNEFPFNFLRTLFSKNRYRENSKIKKLDQFRTHNNNSVDKDLENQRLLGNQAYNPTAYSPISSQINNDPENLNNPTEIQVTSLDSDENQFQNPINDESLRNQEDSLEIQVDNVLAKLSSSGKESLTEEELSILQKASEIFRKKKM